MTNPPDQAEQANLLLARVFLLQELQILEAKEASGKNHLLLVRRKNLLVAQKKLPQKKDLASHPQKTRVLKAVITAMLLLAAKN